MKEVARILAVLLAMTTVAAAAPPQSLTRELVVDAPAMEAWARWTTDEGVRSFFPGAMNGTRIKLERDGPYEFYFLPDNPEGMRGCDGCKILGWQEGKMLSFTWANRPDMAVRPHRTHVVLRFEEIAPDRTRVTLEQDGWGEGDDWRIAYDYFASVWPRVLEAFRASCAESRGQP